MSQKTLTLNIACFQANRCENAYSMTCALCNKNRTARTDHFVKKIEPEKASEETDNKNK